MIMHIILLVCFLPIPLIMYFVLRNETKAKKNLILGVTLPHDRRADPAVTEIVRRFIRRENLVMALLVLLVVPVFFFSHESVVLTWYLTWLLFAITLPFLPYAGGNRRLRALKSRNGWFGASTGVTLVDTKIAVAPKKLLSVWVFIPPFLMTLAPVIHTAAALRGKDEFWPLLCVYLSLTVMVAAFYFLYRLMGRQKAEIVDGSTTRSMALTQVRRYQWNKAWIWIAWLSGLFDLGMWLFNYSAIAIVLLAILYSAVLIGIIMRAEFKTRRVQQKLTEESGREVYTDDDDMWLLGMVYYNKNDSHAMVNKRVGIGMTINLARTPGKVLTVFVVLILLSMPLIGILMMRSEFTPVRLGITGEQITAIHTGTVFTIDIESVTSAYLLDTLPHGVRTNGTGMDTVLQGSFRYDGIGNCRLCLDPRVPPFLVLAADGHTYILGSSSAAETNDVITVLAHAGLVIAG